MKFNKFIVGAVLAFSASASFAATPGPIVTTTVIDLANDDGDYTGFITKDFGKSVSGASFLDIYTFDVASTSTVGISFSSPNNGSKNLTFSSFGLYANGASTPLFSAPIQVGQFFDGSGITQNLTAGHYSFRIGGDVSGLKGGSYSGTVNVSPVPEPETWGMTLSGLAAVGLLARRRKNGQAA
jgi:hypothetical protein